MNCSSVRNRPMPSAAGFVELRQVDEQAGIHLQVDLDPVAADATACRAASGSAPGASVAELGPCRTNSASRFGRRAQMHAAVLAVDDDRVAALRHGDRALDLADDGNAERPRDDDDVAGRRALFQDEAADLARGGSRAVRPRPCERATMIASSGSSTDRPRRGRSAGAAAGWRDRRNRAAARGYTGSVRCIMRARMSLCTFSTAASAVRPLRTASSSRRTQPRSWANMR